MSDSKQADSDRAMARLLADALRQPAGAAADSACPDADMLAAYAEHNLDAAEQAQCEKHFAGCGRCQKILAVLTVSGEEPLSEAELERFGRQVAAVEVGAPIVVNRKPVKNVVSFQRPQTAWAWLASGVGIAAAAALWIALRPAMRPAYVAITAQKTATAPAAPPNESLEARANLPAPPEAAERETEQQQARSPEFAPAPALQAAPALKKESAPAGEAAESPKVPPAAPQASEAEPKPLSESASPSQPVLQATNEPPRDVPRAKQSEAATAAAAPAPAQPASAPPQPQAAPPPPAPAADAAGAQLVVPSPPAPPASQAASEAKPQGKTAPADSRTVQAFAARQAIGGLAAIPPGRIVTLASPSGNVRWRIGPRGEIQRSMDRGQTWQPQTSNVISELVSGAASSDNVAWIVGRAGVILRTTDGQHWERMASPDASADWATVQSSDAQHATIASTDQRRFATEDGGQTWKQQ